MNNMKTSLITLSLICLICLSGAASAESFVREIERTFKVPTGGEVEVDLHGAGNIRFEGTATDGELRFLINMVSRENNASDAEKQFDRLDLQFSEDKDSVLLVVKNKHKEKGWSLWRSSKWPSLEVTVYCPSNFSVSGDTGSGDIDSSGISGNQSFDTGSGDVQVLKSSGNLSVDTGSGSVRIEDFDGPANVDTGSGDVIVRNISGFLNADTGSGNVFAEGSIGSFSADTGSGDVSIETTTPIQKNASADTGSGSITIRLPQQANLKLNLKTNSGKIRVDVPDITPSTTTKYRYRGEIGTRGPELSLNTGSGDIRVQSR